MSKWGHSLPISVFKRRRWIFQWSIPFNSFCSLPHIVSLCQIPWYAMLASPYIKILFFFAIIKSITLAPAALPANQLSHPPCLLFEFSVLSDCSWFPIRKNSRSIRTDITNPEEIHSHVPCESWLLRWKLRQLRADRLLRWLLPSWAESSADQWASSSVATVFTSAPSLCSPVDFSAMKQSFRHTGELLSSLWS